MLTRPVTRGILFLGILIAAGVTVWVSSRDLRTHDFQSALPTRQQEIGFKVTSDRTEFTVSPKFLSFTLDPDSFESALDSKASRQALALLVRPLGIGYMRASISALTGKKAAVLSAFAQETGWPWIGVLDSTGEKAAARDEASVVQLIQTKEPVEVWEIKSHPERIAELKTLVHGTPIAGSKDGADILSWTEDLAPSRKAVPYRSLNTVLLDEWRALAEKHASKLPVWLTEFGPGSAPGEAGITDQSYASLAWLDHLGMAARAHQEVLVRRTLIGGADALIDARTLALQPDYQASLLWHQLMGARVLRVDRAPWLVNLRGYAHCTSEAFQGFRPGAVTVLLINLSQRMTIHARLKDFAGSHATSIEMGTGWASPHTREIQVPDQMPHQMAVPPLTAWFLVFRDAHAQACL